MPKHALWLRRASRCHGSASIHTFLHLVLPVVPRLRVYLPSSSDNSTGVVVGDRGPEFCSPHGHVWGAPAILLCLAELGQAIQPTAHVGYPRGVFERAEVNSWMQWHCTHLVPAAQTVLKQARMGQSRPLDLELLCDNLRFLERRLATHTRGIGGASWTLADLAIGSTCRALRGDVGFDLAAGEDDFPLIAEWLAQPLAP